MIPTSPADTHHPFKGVGNFKLMDAPCAGKLAEVGLDGSGGEFST